MRIGLPGGFGQIDLLGQFAVDKDIKGFWLLGVVVVQRHHLEGDDVYRNEQGDIHPATFERAAPKCSATAHPRHQGVVRRPVLVERRATPLGRGPQLG